jgi:coatomer protein complex subunit epsilon
LQPSDPNLATERDVFMYRAYLALQKYVIVKDEIGANSPQLIQPLKVIIQIIQQSYVHFLKQL